MYNGCLLGHMVIVGNWTLFEGWSVDSMLIRTGCSFQSNNVSRIANDANMKPHVIAIAQIILPICGSLVKIYVSSDHFNLACQKQFFPYSTYPFEIKYWNPWAVVAEKKSSIF